MTKLMYFLLVLYSFGISLFSPRGNILALLTMGLLFFCVVDILRQMRKIKVHTLLPPEMIMALSFVASGLISAFFFAQRQMVGYQTSIMIAQLTVVMIAEVFVIRKDNAMDFTCWSMLIALLIAVVGFIFLGQSFRGSTRMSLEGVNPNSLSMLFVNGAFLLLFIQIGKSRKFKALAFFLVLLFCYGIILTGSRKSLLGIAFLLLLWLMLSLLPGTQRSTKLRILSVSVLLVIVLVIVYFFTPLKDMVMFERLFSDLNSGDEARMGMYKEGYAFFLESPVFGIGPGNFSVRSSYRTYSHSTYIESLSGFGIVGSIFFFGMLIIIFVKLVKSAYFSNQSKDVVGFQRSMLCIAMLGTYAALGLGVIYFYSLPAYILFGFLSGFAAMQLDKYRTKVIRFDPKPIRSLVPIKDSKEIV